MPGYNLQLDCFDPVFLCFICRLVLRKPVQLVTSGERLCLSCYNEGTLSSTTSLTRRVNCRGPALSRDGEAACFGCEYFCDKSMEKEIEKLTVGCRGNCAWRGTVSEYENTHRYQCYLSPQSRKNNLKQKRRRSSSIRDDEINLIHQADHSCPSLIDHENSVFEYNEIEGNGASILQQPSPSTQRAADVKRTSIGISGLIKFSKLGSVEDAVVSSQPTDDIDSSISSTIISGVVMFAITDHDDLGYGVDAAVEEQQEFFEYSQLV